MQTLLTIFSQPPTLSEGATVPFVESCGEFSLDLGSDLRALEEDTEIKADDFSLDGGCCPGVALPTGLSVGAYRIERISLADDHKAVGGAADAPMVPETAFAQAGQTLPLGREAVAADCVPSLAKSEATDDEARGSAPSQPIETTVPAHMGRDDGLRGADLGPDQPGQPGRGTPEAGPNPLQPDPDVLSRSATSAGIVTGRQQDESRPTPPRSAGVFSHSTEPQDLGGPVQSQIGAAGPPHSNDAPPSKTQGDALPDPAQLQGLGLAPEPAIAASSAFASGSDTIAPFESRQYAADRLSSGSGMPDNASQDSDRASPDPMAAEESMVSVGRAALIADSPAATGVRQFGVVGSVWESLFPGLVDTLPQFDGGTERTGIGAVDLPLVEMPLGPGKRLVLPVLGSKDQALLPEPGIVAGEGVYSNDLAKPAIDGAESVPSADRWASKAPSRPALRTEPAGTIAAGLLHSGQVVDLEPGPSDNPALSALSGTPLPGSSVAQSIHSAVGSAIQVPQLAAQMNAALTQSGNGETELALSPDELGHVRLKLKPDAANPDRMVVLITFERPETLDLFRRHAGELADALRSAGYAGADIGFGQEGGDASGSGRNDGFAGDRVKSTAPPEPIVAPPPAPSLAAGVSLDLRL